MDQLRRLEHSQKRNKEIHGDIDKEISRLIEDSRKAIKKINEDVVKEVKKLLEKSGTTQKNEIKANRPRYRG
jgi:hypothetical protein